MLSEVFGLDDGAGALAVSARGGSCHVMSRTANVTEDGTFGQAIPGKRAVDLIREGSRARLLFLRHDNGYRFKLGILNGGQAPITVDWELYASDGTILNGGSTELPPYGNTQIHGVLQDHAPIDGASVDHWTTTPGGAFTYYASLLDDRTNDPTTILPQ